MIAKVCDRESRRDSWFENRLVFQRRDIKLQIDTKVNVTVFPLTPYVAKLAQAIQKLAKASQPKIRKSAIYNLSFYKFNKNVWTSEKV